MKTRRTLTMAIAMIVAASTMAAPRPNKTRQPEPRQTESCQKYHNPDRRDARDRQLNYCPVCGQRLQQAPPKPRNDQPTPSKPRTERKIQGTFGNRR